MNFSIFRLIHITNLIPHSVNPALLSAPREAIYAETFFYAQEKQLIGAVTKLNIALRIADYIVFCSKSR